MARARSIKPGILKNEVLGTADPILYVLFTGLWMIADRDGRLEDRPLRIKAEVFPLRADVDVDALLGWLADNDFIDRYEVKGRKCISINEFVKHQRPHPNEPKSELPVNHRSKARPTNGKPKVNQGYENGASESDQSTAQVRSLTESLFTESLLIESPLPESLDTARFKDVWSRWIQHRREIKAPLKPSQATGQLKKLAKEGEGSACERIERSIANGWRGLWFADDDRPMAKSAGVRQKIVTETEEFLNRGAE